MCFILCIQTIFHMTHTYHCHSSSQMPAKTNIKLSLISCHKSWVYRTMLSHIFEYIKIYNKFPKYSQDIILVKVSTSLILFEYNISTESVTGSFNFIASYILDVWLKGEISHIHTHTNLGHITEWQLPREIYPTNTGMTWTQLVYIIQCTPQIYMASIID